MAEVISDMDMETIMGTDWVTNQVEDMDTHTTQKLKIQATHMV